MSRTKFVCLLALAGSVCVLIASLHKTPIKISSPQPLRILRQTNTREAYSRSTLARFVTPEKVRKQAQLTGPESALAPGPGVTKLAIPMTFEPHVAKQRARCSSSAGEKG